MSDITSQMETGWRVRRERGRRGFAASDTYSFDGYLAEVIAGGVRELLSRGIARPAVCTEDEWKGILKTIAEGFESYVETDDRTPEFERAMELFAKWFGALWD